VPIPITPPSCVPISTAQGEPSLPAACGTPSASAGSRPGRLYGADHGTDWLGDEEQQEELNLVEQGKKYGWPYIYDFSNFNPQDNPPEGMTLEQWAEQSEEPLLGYTAHAAPMQMTFYTGTAFPEEYRGDAFIAMRGSWNRR